MKNPSVIFASGTLVSMSFHNWDIKIRNHDGLIGLPWREPVRVSS